ncbi:NUDIX domain-containing protein [Parapedobacter defluvii]|uniref:NUDIX domain-containing protein n=1 Tax=Parapedobacter defluvii TaxID=2045106 RepID=UPI000F9984CC|nr:MAG: NUDIX domain-containing protein [Parapedobacter sp.]
MKQSAGILLFRRIGRGIQFFLVHPGGPFFVRKDAGAWTIPKGEIIPPENPLDTAIREFEEETGLCLPGPFIPLDAIVQKGGKYVFCWAMEGDLDPEKVVSNTFELEWPPRSGKRVSFPEIDKSGWFTLPEAKQLINERQISLLEQLIAFLD